MTYDSAGRIAKVKNAEGESGAGMQTQWTYSANQLSSITSSGPGWAQPRVQSFKYDAMGRVVETGAGGLNQGEQTPTYRAQTAQGFDAAGRPLWAASALGIAQQNSYDTESRLLQTSRTSNAMLQSSSNRFDALGRLEATWSHTGQGYALAYNALGDVQSITDERGRITELAVGTTKLSANPSTRFTTKQTKPASQELTDDFGRLVARLSPDSGITTYQHDAADRLVASTDALGNTAQYSFDAAGRITRQVITASAAQLDNKPNQPGQQNQPLITAWVYQGKQLVTVKFPTQTEHYSYDARGLKISKMVSLNTSLNTASGTTSAVTRYRYDEAGVLQSTSLPDGSQLVYERNGQGQVVALKRSELQTPWLQRWASWMLPVQVIAQDLKRDIVGIKSYTTGNGIQASYQRSQNAALARVVYRSTKPGSTKLQTAANTSTPNKLPMLMGATAQDTISALLGISPAYAADAPRPTEQSIKSELPGALGLPNDPQALIDHRYLWDTAGNLLLTQSDTRGKASTAAYAYDSQDRLIIASQNSSPAMKQVSASSDDNTNNTNSGQTTSRYHYAQGKRVLAQEGVLDAADLKTHTIKAAYQEGSHRWLGGEAVNNATQSQTSYNANGQPGQAGPRSYSWDALGRLASVQQNNQPVASYSYNHRGERISKTVQTEAGQSNTVQQTTSYLYENGLLSAELNQAGQLTRQYIYLADMPIAVIDTPQGKSLSNQELPAHTLLGLDLQIIVKTAWNALTNGNKAENTSWLHTNHLGAPEAATDSQGKVIWQASYAPFGGLVKTSLKTKEAFTLNLRLPGQYEDTETGLHYNKQRYYDPSRGEYLSPDPLGTPDGPNGYSYVRYNPLKYVDPEGLILFAFDGTGNTNNAGDLAELDNGISNVWNFRQLYNDGNARYVTGVGTRHRETDPKLGGDIFLNWGNTSTVDMGTNDTGPRRIERMVAYFNAEAELFTENTKMMDVDIIGFSRGAAQARDFANRINANTKNGQYSYTVKGTQGRDVRRCQMINFRFLGLWDTVLSTNLSGTGYNLGIVPGFQYVAQAIALNEYRGNTLRNLAGSTGAFPLESVMGGTVPIGQSRVEMGFIGAHADIGGGFATNNEISRVSLAWMIEQARDAGVKMNDSPVNSVPASAIIHDKSDNQYCLNGPGCSEDRAVRGGAGGTQRRMTGTGMTYADTGQFISYYPSQTNPRGGQSRTPRADGSTGTVDMAKYLAWLRSNGYNVGNLQAR